MSTYREPLEKFLKLGKPDTHQEKDWLNYIKEYGLTEEHIPDLMKMMLDNSTDEFIEPDSYSAVHAWRCLGQLKAVEAIESLFEVIKRDVWEEWGWEEVPVVLAMIGEPAIEPLQKILAESAQHYDLRPTIFESSLGHIAKKHPDLKERVLEIVVNQLRDAANNDRTLNGFLIANLLDFKYEAALPVIETAYTLNYVDTGVCGDWYDAQVVFGLKPPKPIPQFLPPWEDDSDSSTIGKSQAKKKKKKRKMAQKSRKQNRKKKKKK